jgi:hypothetical protein
MTYLRDVDVVAWDGFLWMRGRIGDLASGPAAARMRWMAQFKRFA